MLLIIGYMSTKIERSKIERHLIKNILELKYVDAWMVFDTEIMNIEMEFVYRYSRKKVKYHIVYKYIYNNTLEFLKDYAIEVNKKYLLKDIATMYLLKFAKPTPSMNTSNALKTLISSTIYNRLVQLPIDGLADKDKPYDDYVDACIYMNMKYWQFKEIS